MKLNPAYMGMVVAQTPAIGDASFQDVLRMCCGL